MSDFRAIGATTSTLQTLLTDQLDCAARGREPLRRRSRVTVGVPPEDGNGEESPRVNLFLYRVTQNGYLANQEIPGRGPRGTAEVHPPLALDLHYLLTAYGSMTNQFLNDGTDEVVAHYLLGQRDARPPRPRDHHRRARDVHRRAGARPEPARTRTST